MRAGLNTFQPESTRIKASPKREHPITRPDTRPIPVADGWAGAKMRVFTLFDSCLRSDGRTDKGSYRVACPQLKIITLGNDFHNE